MCSTFHCVFNVSRIVVPCTVEAALALLWKQHYWSEPLLLVLPLPLALHRENALLVEMQYCTSSTEAALLLLALHCCSTEVRRPSSSSSALFYYFYHWPRSEHAMIPILSLGDAGGGEYRIGNMINSQFEEIRRHLPLLSFGKGETNTMRLQNVMNTQFKDPSPPCC